MWRDAEAKEKDKKTHEALRGATGSGNVAIGPNSGAIVNVGNNNAAATTVNVGNTGTSAFGTVNVGRGATAVFIGDNVASAITLGRSTGSVTLGPPLTLGAAPTGVTGATLGYVIKCTNIYIATFTSGQVGNYATIDIPIAGIYLFNFLLDASTGGGIVTSALVVAKGANVPTTNMYFVGSPANTTGSWAISGSYVVSCTASTYSLSDITWTGGSSPATLLLGYSFFTATRIG